MRKRMCEIKIRLTAEELTDLNTRVKQTGYSREEFCRRALTGAEIRQAPPVDVPILFRELRRASVSIEQLLKLANRTHSIDTKQVRKVLEQTFLVSEAIVRAYTK